MPLARDKVERLWHLRQKTALPGGFKGRILSSLWAPPLLLIAPLMFSKFSPGVVRACVVTFIVYLLYGFATYVILRLWSPSIGKSISRERMSVLMVLTFDGLSLLFLSVIFLWTAILGINYLPFDGCAIVAAIVVLCVTEIAFVLVRAAYFVTNMLEKSTQLASEGQVRWALGILSGLVGIGVCLGTILRGSPLAITAAIGFAVLGGLMLLPFSIFALYQVSLMAWSWIDKDCNDSGA
jgi:hypothetical protein